MIGALGLVGFNACSAGGPGRPSAPRASDEVVAARDRYLAEEAGRPPGAGQEPVDGRLVDRTYDVRFLFPRLPAADLSDRPQRDPRRKALTDLITGSTGGPGDWPDRANLPIRFSSAGFITVRHLPRIHRQIEQLLGLLN